MIYFAYGYNRDNDDEFHITVGETHRDAVEGTETLCDEKVCHAWLGDAREDHPDAYICEDCVMELARRAGEAGQTPRLCRSLRPIIEPPV
ncbi:MAG TPA: hypothetical protein VGV69_01125 [Solirubrobacterales bacterium]|nr:hypothetical protein [Solirubrobacterales bacterium]